jgi:ATP-binding cassette, subfamily B, bacterial
MNLIWNYVKQYKRLLFLALFLAAINQFFSLLDPQIFRLIVDNYATKASEVPKEAFIQGVFILLLGIVGVALVSRIAKNFQDYFVNVVTQRAGARMYAQSVQHSFSLPYAVFEDQRSGELLQKLQKARTDLQVVITSFVNTVFLSFIGILFVLVYALTVHWAIALLYAIAIPFMAMAIFMLSRRIKAAQKAIVAETAELAGSTTETLRNVELVKSLGLEEQEVNRLNDLNERILQLELKKIRLIRTLSFIQGTLVNAVRSGLLFLMLWLIFQKAISLGEFFSLLFYSFFIFFPLGELGTISTQFQESKASLEQLQEVLKIPPQEKPKDAVKLGNVESIRFDDVSFQYASGNTPAVRNATLEIKAGEQVAFVGPSGSGKTTVLKLIAGLYRPSSGRLSINGVDSEKVDYEEFRRRIGLVSQETQLFAGTIRENLLFVSPNASDEDCIKAMEQAAAGSILARGDKGLDTKIGEGGIKVSGGERQRLAIARALLRDPEIIVFDEATSSLDSLTEKEITETIREIVAKRPEVITIMVAHRLSTVSHAKRIYVMEKGAVIEIGDHDQLLKEKGLYAALWREQSGGTV